jgi:hypothetical protein
MVQRKGNKIIGEAQTPICRALPIVTEIAYYFCCAGQRQKYVQYETTAKSKVKILLSVKVKAKYPTMALF